MAASEVPPYDVHLPYEGEACGEFMLTRLMEPLAAAGYNTYTTKYYLPGQPLLDEFIKGVQQSRVTVLPLCRTFMASQYYWYVVNSIHDRSIIREGSAIFVKTEELEDCPLSLKLKPFGFLDFTTDAAYREAYPRLLRTLGPPSCASAPQPQQHVPPRADDNADDTYDDVFVNNEFEEEDQEIPGSNFVHATHRSFDAVGPQIHTDLVVPEKALLTACKEFEWSGWSLKAFCHDPDSYIQRVQKITPPLRDDVEKVLLLAILPQQQTHRGSCITLAKLSCCGLPRVEEQALEALLTVIHQNMFHQGTDYAESSGLSDVTREVLYVLSNREALRQWTRGTALLRMHVCCILLICLHVSYVNGDIGLELSAEELKKTQAVIKRKFETFEATDLSFRCLADFYIHTINEASKRIAGKLIGKFKELVMQAREAISINDPTTTKQLVKDICRADEYDQHIVLSHLADMAYDSETALEIFQRVVYKLAQTCGGSRADRLFILIAEMFVKILRTTKRPDLCCIALRPPPPTNGKRKTRLGLAELWYEQQFNLGSARLAVEAICRLLLHHPQPTVRETMARRLAMRQGGRADDIEWEDLVPIEAKHISDQYKMLGLRIVTHQPTPCQDLEGHVVWKGTTTHGNVAIKVYKLNSLQDLMGDADMSEGARTVRNNVRMLGELSDNPNILQLMAYQLRPQPVFHITEFMEEENLLDFLLRKRQDHQHTGSSLLYLRDIMTLLLDMVAALRFCHHHDIVHRDVIARNFLVYKKNGRYRCKLGNFNMAAKAPTIEEETYECPDCLQLVFQGCSDDPVAKLWTAPESMVGYQFSDKSDVWMLGCAMYEVLTHGCRPFTEMWGMAADDIVQQVVFGLRPRQPSCVPRKLFQTAMLPCFLADPAERIALLQLERKLRSYIKECPLPGVEHIDDIHPPPRLSPNQSTRPERGIPRNLEKQISIKPEVTMTDYKMEKGKFPCSASELLAYDQPNDQGEEFLLETAVDRRRREMLLRLDHVNIRRVIDIIVNGDHVKQMSQVFYGGQLTLLAAATEKRLSVDDMVRCLRQVADAMAFAHGSLVKGEGIIHCDLRAMYVIWNGQHVKVGRWGRASRLRLRLYDTKLSESVVTKPMPQDALRWSPMEVIESGIYSQGSDVFTFGQLCWEVFHAYNADKASENRMLAPYPYMKASEVLPYLQRRQRPLQPCDCPDWLYRLMKLCWLDERSRRPGFDKIVACFNSPSTSPLLDIGDNGTYKQHAPGGNEESLNAALNHQDLHYFRQGLLQSDANYTLRHCIVGWNAADNVSQSSVDTFFTMTSEVSNQTVDTVSSDVTSGTWQSAESRSRAGTNSTQLSDGSPMCTPTENLDEIEFTTVDLQSNQSVAGSEKSSRGQEVVYKNSLSRAPLVAELNYKLQGAQLTVSDAFDDGASETSDALDDEAEEKSEIRVVRTSSFLNPSYGHNVPSRTHEMQDSPRVDRPDTPAGVAGEDSDDDGEANDDADYYTKLRHTTLSSSAHSAPPIHHTNDENRSELSARPPVPPRPSTGMAASPYGRDSSAEMTPREDTPPPPVPPRVVLNGSAEVDSAQDDPPYADVRVRRKSHDAVPLTPIPRPLSMGDIYSTQYYRQSWEYTGWNQKSNSNPPSIALRPALRYRVDSDTSPSSQASSYLGSSQESLPVTSPRSSVKGSKGVLRKIKSSFKKKYDREKSRGRGDSTKGARGDGVFRYTSEAEASNRLSTSSVCSDYRDDNTDENSDQEFDTRL
ncbi:FRK [Branchiostoma lanceolatum]|uniref:FRK protein n=1 Tax=Branchiostoma lanceolatum TaxID=7740 RepID=A0A8K0EA17_BRALA|nr:FRK [Branchiostoma lanceolatum]